MQDNQLAIRIQLKKKPTEAKETLQILWGRVIAVVLVTILVVGLAVWLLWRAIPGPDANDFANSVPPSAPATVVPGTPKPEVAPVAAADQSVSPVSGDLRSANGDGAQAAKAVTAPVPKPDAPIAATSKGAVADPAEAAAPVLTSEAVSTSAAATPNETATTEVAAPETLTSERAPPDNTLAPEQPGKHHVPGALAKVDIRSGHVGRAAISQTREGRTPGAPLSEVVAMDGRNLITLYMFTRYQNLSGQWVFHDWYRNGKREARVRVRPHLAEMDIYSSKFIDTHMLGDWQVKVRTAAGTLLAETSFTVVP